MPNPRPLASPRHVTDRSLCAFYHSMDLPSGPVEGHWDLRGRIVDYIGGVDVAGRSVVDVGTASGFLSFEMERLGASVVSFDAESADNVAFVPIHDQPQVTQPEYWQGQVNHSLERLKNSYWFAHRDLESRASALYGDIYRLDSYGHRFQTAVIGQILVHLKDPVHAICAVARACTDTLVITEGTIESDYPDVRFCGHSVSGGLPYMWWMGSVPFYRDVLATQNFEIQSVSRNTFTCRNYARSDVALTTMVAKRKAS